MSDDDYLLCKYSLFIIQRTKRRAHTPLSAVHHTIGIEKRYAEVRPVGPLDITVTVIATGVVPVSDPVQFTADECFDV